MTAESRYLAAKITADNGICGMHIVGADIFAYSLRKTYAQAKVIAAFTACFRSAIVATDRAYTQAMARVDAHLQRDALAMPTGDGVVLALPFDGLPGLGIDFVDALVEAVHTHNGAEAPCADFAENGYCDCHARLHLRIGISDGQAVLYRDFTERLNIAGTPVNRAVRVMSLAEPGQVFISDAAYQTLVENVPGRADQFRPYYQAEIKHGDRIDVHQYTNPALAGLDIAPRAGISLMQTETQPDMADVSPDRTQHEHRTSDTTVPTRGHRKPTCIQQLVTVAATQFTMGTESSGPVEVRFSRGFLIGAYLVTQDDYQIVMGRNPSHFVGDRLPVEMVSWFDAVAFCNELSTISGLTPIYDIVGQEVTSDVSRDGYRLPTEAEWELCCRGEHGGDEHYAPLDEIAWYSTNADSHTHPVASLSPNRGVYDLLGNTWEWSNDWYQRGHPTSPQVDYSGPDSGFHRILRGGSWRDRAVCVTATYRHHESPSKRDSTIGFRIARSLANSHT